MEHSERLRKAFKDKGLSITFIAKKLNVDRRTVYQRLEDVGSFKAKEIEVLADLLRMSNKERDSIFFSNY